MAKYIFLYRGPATPMEEFTAEESAKQLAAWSEWGGKAGAALVDFGNPFGQRVGVSDDGSSVAPGDLNGYSVVEADSIEDARKLVDGHPFLTEGKSRFSIEIFELVPMPQG